MKKMSAVILLAMTFIFTLAFTTATPPESGTLKTVLEKAPDFELENIDGEMVKLSDYRGKIVILDFWATWCPPCRAGIPDFVELQEKYGDDLQIIGISLDTDTKDDVKPFIEEYKINYPVVWGTMDVVADYGNIQSIPTTFVIDQEGGIVKKHIGLKPKATFEKDIESLLK